MRKPALKKLPETVDVMAIDVGNTHVHIGVDKGADGVWDQMLRFDADPRRTADEWNVLVSGALIGLSASTRAIAVGLASVVPGVTRNLAEYVDRFLGRDIITVSPDLDLGISVGTDQPYETGQDRIANAVAAFKPGRGSVIMIDMGTATKVDVVDSDGVFLGGAIGPGLGLSLETLAGRAARLYAVPLQAPDSAIGSSTTSAVQAGVVLGHLAMIEGLVDRQTAEIGGVTSILLTGGFANVVASSPPAGAIHKPHLTLDGVRAITIRNVKR